MAQIKTYARLKPSKRAYPGYEIADNVLTVHIPDNKDFLLQGSQQPIRSNISYDIVFTDIFRPEATQEEVFNGVAKDIIQNFLNGYNGTIFAYGQTGTGKTYTVEGNSSGYHTRGLATRALSMIYQQLEKRTDEHISVYLSYLEIYQEVAYDLLNPASRSSSLPMPPFAKSIKEVTVVEGPRGSCILRGLSLHLAANEEIAQMLLYQGQVNRKVAETPVNQRSSRSHAVFTVYLQVRKHESEVLVNSKLHLVDLAGSERVSKTGVDGQQLTEAKSINLSLHHLETVIIALQSDRTNTPSNTTAAEKSKGDNLPTASRSTSFTSGPSSEGNRPVKFVPYRNSLLTMVLKDSLGGNCLTAMIATISLEPENLGESISTCRFAQRVARIANNARRNEEIDDKTLIKRLKHKVADLEHQVALLRSKGKSEPISEVDLLGVLTEEDRIVCARIMEGFLQGVITDPVDAGICDQCRFRECLHFLKHQCLQPSNVPWVLPQQDREVPSDRPEAVLPNNPHRDSGDHVMNTTSQGTSPIVAVPNAMLPASTSLKLCTESAQQSSSEATIYSSDDYLLGNVDIGQAEGGIDVNKSGGGSQVAVRKKGEKPASAGSCSKKGSACKKSSKKARKLDDDKLSRYEQMDKMKLDSLINELTISENNLSFKLHVTDEQVLDQHAYLSQLRQLQAEPELIAKEQLVEKHLLKRQAKFREKLGQVILQKSKLGRLLNQDMSSPASSAPQRVPGDEFKQGKSSLNSKQVFDLLRAEEKSLKDCAEGDIDAYDSKVKLCAASKEPTNTEKYQEIKHIFKMSQKPKETAVDVPSAACPKEIDKMESNQSSLYHPLRQGFDAEMDAFPCSFSPVAEDRNGSRSKDGVMSSISEVDASDMHVKRLQEYLDQVLNVAFIDKFASDARQCDSISPSSRAHDRAGPIQPLSNPLYHAGGGKDVNKDSLSPGFGGVMPTEVKSLHDPRHSHKFAMDDRPYESSSLVTPEKNNIESLYSGKNINNSTDSRSLSSRVSKSADRKLAGRGRDSAGRNQNNSNKHTLPAETVPLQHFTKPCSRHCACWSRKDCTCSFKILLFTQDALLGIDGGSSIPVCFTNLSKRNVKPATNELSPCSSELAFASCRENASVVMRTNRTRDKSAKFPQHSPLPCKNVDKHSTMVMVKPPETLKSAPPWVSLGKNDYTGMLPSTKVVIETHTSLRITTTHCSTDLLSLQQETSVKFAGTKNNDMSSFFDARKELFQLGKSKHYLQLLPDTCSRKEFDKDTCFSEEFYYSTVPNTFLERLAMPKKILYTRRLFIHRWACHDDSDMKNPLDTVRPAGLDSTGTPGSVGEDRLQASWRAKRKPGLRWAAREPGC